MGEEKIGMDRREWLYVSEFAALLRVHPATVRRWIQEGRMNLKVRTVGMRRRQIHRDGLKEVVK